MRTLDQLIGDLEKHCETVREVLNPKTIDEGRAMMTDRISIIELESLLRHLRSLALSPDERMSLFDIKADIEDTWDGDDKRTVRALALIERLTKEPT